jgi:hypothetical protein
MKVRGKEIKLNSQENYAVNLGTINNKNPTCFYFNIKGWTTPKDDSEEDYGKVVRLLNKRIKNKLHNIIDDNKYLKDITIVDLDLRESGIRYGKKSYFNCEVTMYQKNTGALLEISPEINKITNDIISGVLEPFEYFSFYKSK